VAGGQEWQPEVMAYAVEHPLADLSRVDDYLLPNPDRRDLVAGLLDGIDREESLIIGAMPFLLFERAHVLVGMENLLLHMASAPDRVRRLFRRIADFQIRVVERYAAAGVEAIRATDDYGTQESLMMSPRMWREVIKPELARIFAATKKAGLILFLHTCGRVMDIVPDLIEIGVDVLDPIQSLSNDLPALKREYGSQISFMGGVDTQYLLTRGTPAEIEATVRERMRVMGAGGGYIIGPDNRIPISEENNRAFMKAIRRYGVHPLEG
jgi:uroporphyrinogen decarboxylase